MPARHRAMSYVSTGAPCVTSSFGLPSWMQWAHLGRVHLLSRRTPLQTRLPSARATEGGGYFDHRAPAPPRNSRASRRGGLAGLARLGRQLGQTAVDGALLVVVAGCIMQEQSLLACRCWRSSVCYFSTWPLLPRQPLRLCSGDAWPPPHRGPPFGFVIKTPNCRAGRESVAPRLRRAIVPRPRVAHRKCPPPPSLKPQNGGCRVAHALSNLSCTGGCHIRHGRQYNIGCATAGRTLVQRESCSRRPSLQKRVSLTPKSTERLWLYLPPDGPPDGPRPSCVQTATPH